MSTGQTAPEASSNVDSRQRIRFSLSELFILTTMICVAGGLLTWAMQGDPIAATLFFFVTLGTVAFAIHVFTRWTAGTVVASLVVLCLVGFCLLLPAVTDTRTPARRASCSNNLRNLMLALLQYEADHGQFPPPYIADEEGKPMHSWRILVLPYLEKQDLYAQYRFDEPWDGPNNSRLHNERVLYFNCPSDGPSRTTTSYVAVVGTETMWPPSKSVSLAEVTNKDGASNTIMLVEVHNSGIHWMEPRDLDFSQMAMVLNSKNAPSISSGHEGGAQVAFADGHTRFLPNDTPAKAVRAALTRAGGETVELP